MAVEKFADKTLTEYSRCVAAAEDRKSTRLNSSH